jgi:hypothetical protein
LEGEYAVRSGNNCLLFSFFYLVHDTIIALFLGGHVISSAGPIAIAASLTDDMVSWSKFPRVRYRPKAVAAGINSGRKSA